jgi:tyrosyl-tRNA synthetase
LVHGADETSRIESASNALFGQGDLASLDAATLGAALRETPHVQVPAGPLPPVVDLLTATDLVASKSAARRTIQEGGAYLNNERITDVDREPSEDDLVHGRWLVLRRGKRNLAAVEVV